MNHNYQRPSWDCGACGRPWPCSPAKVELGERYKGAPFDLWFHMLGRLYAAAGEIPVKFDPSELHARFLDWTEIRRPSPRRR